MIKQPPAKRTSLPRMATGVRNLDAILGGGIPRGAVTVLAGPPGSGKTILAEQVCFHNATDKEPALYFSTLTEPTTKTLRYVQQFAFFDPAKLEDAVQFVDLGVLLRSNGLGPAIELLMDHVKRVRPAIVVIDSFKVFNDLASSPEALRKFGYEVVVNLMAWEVTALLLGEYSAAEFQKNPIFSVIDGVISLTQCELSAEEQRFIQVVKMRGTPHSRDEHPFVIDSHGIDVYAPRVTIQRSPNVSPSPGKPVERVHTGISNLDELLGEGIPSGSSLLVSGAAGTGKTLLLLEFVYRGALAGQKGLFVSFEETAERLRATARGLGWDLDDQIKRGMIEIVFIPQPDILVEKHLLMIADRLAASRIRRVSIDSVSVFLHKIKDSRVVREKVFQLATLVHNAEAVGLFASDVPYGVAQISRFGVEETVVDGVVLLTAVVEGLARRRYIEIYKLRNTSHFNGRHAMDLGPGGIAVYPRYEIEPDSEKPREMSDERLPTGVPGLDALLGGGVFESSVTMVSGSTGTGKSTLATQFLLEGAARGEKGVFISLGESRAQIVRAAESTGLPLAKALSTGMIEFVYVSQERLGGSEVPHVVMHSVRAVGARRLVIDGASDILGGELESDGVRRILHVLVDYCRRASITTVVTVESGQLVGFGTATARGLSAIADNLILMRYVLVGGRLRRSLVVLKARATDHRPDIHGVEISTGGLHIGAPIDDEHATEGTLGIEGDAGRP